MIDNIVEIGAGDFSSCKAKNFVDTNVPITIFEPNVLFYKDLGKNFAGNKNVSIINKAVSWTKGVQPFYNFGYAGWVKDSKGFFNLSVDLDGKTYDYEKYFEKISLNVDAFCVSDIVTKNALITNGTYLILNCNGAEMWVLNNIRSFPSVVETSFYCHNSEHNKINREVYKWFVEHGYNPVLLDKDGSGTFFNMRFVRNWTPIDKPVKNRSAAKPIHIFFHVFCVNNYVQMFRDSFDKIKKSGLLDRCENIHVCVNSQIRGINTDDFKVDDKIKVYEFYEKTHGEMNTLNLLWDFCQTNDCDVLYLYSKGVTHSNSKFSKDAIDSWREYMEFFNIFRFEDCIEKLKNHDTCGVDHSEWSVGGWHYAGNFWWADSDYIRKLPKMNVKNRYRKNIVSDDDERWVCEFWLMDNEFVNPASLHQALGNNGYLVNHYETVYDKENYE